MTYKDLFDIIKSGEKNMKINKKTLNELVIGQIIKDIQNHDLTAIEALVSLLTKKQKISFLQEDLTKDQLNELLQLAKSNFTY